MKLLIDLSEHNGYADLSLAKESIDGVIARCSWGWGRDQIDKQWQNNATQANQLNIPLFAYHFAYARNEEEAIKEAELAIQTCKNYCVGVIYYDMEYSTFQGNLSNDQYYSIAKAFCDKVEAANLSVGIYANEYWFRTKLVNAGFSKWTLWLANYGSNDGYNKWGENLPYNPFGHVLVHQFTSKAKNGILKEIRGIQSTFLDCSMDHGLIDTFGLIDNTSINVGDKVMVKENSVWYDGKTIPNFVYATQYIVIEVIKDRVVIGIDDKVTGAISINSLIKI